MIDVPEDEMDGPALEAGLRAAFGPESRVDERRTWGMPAPAEESSGLRSPIHLRDEPEEPGKTPQPLLERGPVWPGEGGRYEIVGEIARGGVGVVLRGRDPRLGREIALKVLRDEHAGKAAMSRRLIEEAQIGGQLQHPGILPVYELGLDDGARPYFTMKLVRGRTLAALLRDRPDPSQQRRRFLAIFEQVAQAVAYAHTRGVIHRDLKPANILVGHFGEAQVVDWGLAKVLTRVDTLEKPGGHELPEADIATIRSGDPGLQSEAGSVLGTPAYMAPEQARGDVEGLDERCDVFALGAILCEILTGRPPYAGDRHEALAQAREGRLDDAVARLAVADTDGELVRLARQCLDPVQEQRPRDASQVAQRVAEWAAGVEERSRAAEREAAAARARAVAERRARRWTVGSALAVLLAVLVGGAAYLHAERRRQDEARRAELRRIDALQDALALFTSLQTKGSWLMNQAASAPEQHAAVWADTLFLCRKAVEKSEALEVDQETRERRRQLADELQQAEAAARRRADEYAAREKSRAKAGPAVNP